MLKGKYIKVNFDGGFRKNVGGYGYVVADESGNLVHGYGGVLSSCCYSHN